MGKLDVTDRLAFLAEKFDVFKSDKVKTTDEDGEDVIITEKKTVKLKEDGWEVIEILGGEISEITGKLGLMGILSTKLNKRGFQIKRVSVHYDVFTAMVGADPTLNKICLQWMLNTFVRLLKDEEYDEARRFCGEDLPQANEYLTLFESNKRKKRFREMAKYNLKGIKDITNINEYRSLSQLFDAVDPFIHRDPTEVESIINKYVSIGEGVIPFKDRRYTVFIPLTTEANVIFDKFSSWCTAKSGNGMFNRLTTDNKTPLGSKSKIYVVIDNEFFTGNNDKIYQIHFETKQIMDRNNSRSSDFYESVLCRSEGLLNYFGSELIQLAKDYAYGYKHYNIYRHIDTNNYIDILIEFGFTEVLFDFFDEETPIIRIDSETATKKRRVPKIPDVSRFKMVTHFIIMDASLHDIHPSIGSLTTLKNLVFSGNKITELPKEIGKLKNLVFLNLWGNPIKHIPEDIRYLDPHEGGHLKRIAVSRKHIGEDNYNKLKYLLPNVTFSD